MALALTKLWWAGPPVARGVAFPAYSSSNTAWEDPVICGRYRTRRGPVSATLSRLATLTAVPAMNWLLVRHQRLATASCISSQLPPHNRHISRSPDRGQTSAGIWELRTSIWMAFPTYSLSPASRAIPPLKPCSSPGLYIRARATRISCCRQPDWEMAGGCRTLMWVT